MRRLALLASANKGERGVQIHGRGGGGGGAVSGVVRKVIVLGLVAVAASVLSSAADGDPMEPANVLGIVDMVTVNGRTVSSSWDSPTRTLTTSSPLGREVSTRFDVFGRVVETTAPGILPVTYGYDARGRLESVLQGGRETRTTYDADGNVEVLRDG
jgi:YD repeat-containing protein